MDRQAITPALYHFFWQAADWVFPPSCAGCGRPGYRWCPDCDRNSHPIEGTICEHCGLPLPRRGKCQACRLHPPEFDALRSWSVYTGPLRKAIHRLKYQRDLGLAEPLAQKLLLVIRTQAWQPELIVVVPLANQRLRQRGYNQTRELARPLSYLLHIPYTTRALQRVRETRTQVGLSAEERRNNVAGAFFADRTSVAGKRILLVDDVATTGATLSASAAALRAAGAQQVFAVTLARAVKLSDHASEAAETAPSNP